MLKNHFSNLKQTPFDPQEKKSLRKRLFILQLKLSLETHSWSLQLASFNRFLLSENSSKRQFTHVSSNLKLPKKMSSPTPPSDILVKSESFPAVSIPVEQSDQKTPSICDRWKFALGVSLTLLLVAVSIIIHLAQELDNKICTPESKYSLTPQ